MQKEVGWEARPTEEEKVVKLWNDGKTRLFFYVCFNLWQSKSHDIFVCAGKLTKQDSDCSM